MEEPIFTAEKIWAAARETARLQAELDIANADHVALWLEANKDNSSLGWLACRIVEANEQGLALANLGTQRLYDVLDRLVDSLIEGEGDHPDHRYSPLGSALHALHELRPHATERCVCAQQYSDPPA